MIFHNLFSPISSCDFREVDRKKGRARLVLEREKIATMLNIKVDLLQTSSVELLCVCHTVFNGDEKSGRNKQTGGKKYV